MALVYAPDLGTLPDEQWEVIYLVRFLEKAPVPSPTLIIALVLS